LSDSHQDPSAFSFDLIASSPFPWSRDPSTTVITSLSLPERRWRRYRAPGATTSYQSVDFRGGGFFMTDGRKAPPSARLRSSHLCRGTAPGVSRGRSKSGVRFGVIGRNVNFDSSTPSLQPARRRAPRLVDSSRCPPPDACKSVPCGHQIGLVCLRHWSWRLTSSRREAHHRHHHLTTPARVRPRWVLKTPTECGCSAPADRFPESAKANPFRRKSSAAIACYQVYHVKKLPEHEDRSSAS
jgi:hypothetical protein